jgi:hypothetical protein
MSAIGITLDVEKVAPVPAQAGSAQAQVYPYLRIFGKLNTPTARMRVQA